MLRVSVSSIGTRDTFESELGSWRRMYAVSFDKPEVSMPCMSTCRTTPSECPVSSGISRVSRLSESPARKHIRMNVHSLQQHLKPDKSPKTPNLDTQTSPSNNPPPNSSSNHDSRKLSRTEVIPSKQCQAKVLADDS